jgi:CelD/BcsL family acetyltransferase involved in cellulose biosynthesis
MPMQIDVFRDVSALPPLRRNWEAVYAADPEAHSFLSWTWMSLLFERFGYDWLILAARPEGETDYVGFFPLKIVTRPRAHGEFYDEIQMAGFPRGDYTGALVLPSHEDEAMAAFARHLRTRPWARIALKYLRLSQRRLDCFLAGFDAAGFTLERPVHLTDGIDNTICPHVALPGSWEEFLATRLGSNARQKARRFLKKIDAGGPFRITHATADTYVRDVAALQRFWEAQWGASKGARLPSILSGSRKMLHGLFEAGLLVLPVFWKDETPLCVLALIKDEKNRWLQFQVGGRDESFQSPPPGFLLHAHSIRWAIAQGYRVYDFMRGNEPYKYMFGCEERLLAHVTLSHRDSPPPFRQLDARSLDFVLDRAKEWNDSGDRVRAERAYRQVLAAQPGKPRTLYLLAQLLARKGAHAEAILHFRHYLAQRPGKAGGWLRYGKTLAALGERKEAAACFAKVLELDPREDEAASLLADLSPAKDLRARSL